MLESTDVRLVPLGPDDITDEYVGWLNDPAVFRFLQTKFGQTRASVRRYVESVTPPSLLCRIIWKSGDRHVGNISLHMFDPVHRRMDLGIMIGASEARGRGLGRQACSLLIQHGFDHLNLHKITAGTVDGNAAMEAVFLGLGFTVEGRLREHYYVEGTYRDVVVFGLLRPDFKAAL
jgi:ribosomal-protein-alanine N-acetyltransferase